VHQVGHEYNYQAEEQIINDMVEHWIEASSCVSSSLQEHALLKLTPTRSPLILFVFSQSDLGIGIIYQAGA
jgi:hypothetical protein